MPYFRLSFIKQSPPSRDTARRLVLLIAIVTLHLLVIRWLASSPPEWIAHPATEDVFTVSLVNGSDTPAEIMPTKAESRIATPFPIPTVLATMPAADASPLSGAGSASPGGETGDGCTLARDAGEAIGQDPFAMAELEALPPSVRTSADAVMLWNGQWLDLGVMAAGIGRGSLRRVVEQVVENAPAECRNAEAIGPQFIPVLEGERTVTIVIGSGVWHWADLVASSADCLVADAAACLAETTIQNAD